MVGRFHLPNRKGRKENGWIRLTTDTLVCDVDCLPFNAGVMVQSAFIRISEVITAAYWVVFLCAKDVFA